MHLKDYYKILELEPSASLAEIKQAFRRMAQQHHPDKNNQPYSANQFAAIKEAYEILTNPAKKEQYLQQRWYNQSIGKKKTQTIVTPVTILKEALELERYVSKLDVHRMDRQGLYEYMQEQLDDTTIEKLKSFNEQEVNDQVIFAILKSARVLKTAQATAIGEKLYRIAGNETKIKIATTIRAMEKKEKWENKEVLLVLLVTILICLLIWLSI